MNVRAKMKRSIKCCAEKFQVLQAFTLVTCKIYFVFSFKLISDLSVNTIDHHKEFDVFITIIYAPTQHVVRWRT